MKRKSKLAKFNTFLAVVLCVCIIATIYIVTRPLPAVQVDGGENAGQDVVVIDAFAPGTYGGKTFDTVEDVVNYYVECYNYTKTLTATYKENGETKTYYKLVAEESLVPSNVLVEGKSNSIIDGIVPGVVSGIFKGGVNGLPPSGNRNPELDSKDTSNGPVDCRTSALTAEDVLAANVKDNNDGTITITIQPKEVILSMPCEDAQGRFFNTLGDISSVVNSIDVLSFSSGTIDENFVVDYKGGSGTIKIDTTTNEIVEADYVMKVHIDVQHANVLVLKNKSASLDITYTNHLPASDDYLMKSKGLERA